MGDAPGEHPVLPGLIHYGFLQSTPFWVSCYEEDPDRPVLTVTFKRKRTPFRVVPVKTSNIMLSYSEAFILQYNTEEPHWADPLEMKLQLVDYLLNRRQSGCCPVSGKSLTLYQKRRLELGTAKLTDYFQLRLKVKGGICYGLAVHHECTHPYLAAVSFQEERFEYGFRNDDIPKESRQALRARFGKEMNGWSLLESEELPAQFLLKRNLFL